MAQLPNPKPILLAARAGRAGAAEELLRAWAPVVLGWCNRLGGPKVNPEDAAQDVLMKVLTHLHTIRQPERFAGWLFQVTRSVVRQHRRAAWVRGWVPGLQVEMVDEGSDPLAWCAEEQTARRVQSALERLPDAQREVVVLCDLEERPAVEVAALLGIPAGTVKSRLRLGRERFRRAAQHLGLAPEQLATREEP